MNRVKYFVLRSTGVTWRIEPDVEDESEDVHFFEGDVVMTQVLPEGEIFEPPPAVRRGIEELGWRIVERKLGASGLNDHGHVDWKAVADALAAAVEALQGSEDPQVPELPESAARALDDYRIAVAEVALAHDSTDTEEESTDG